MTGKLDMYSTPMYGTSAVLISAAWFYGTSLLVSQHVPQSSKSVWKFKNIFLSLIHAAISGLWALYCLVSNPTMAEDVINSYDTSAYTLVCFSIGYFLYDSLDMLVYYRKRESFELLGHHAVIFLCFGVALVSGQYVGYAVVALIAELNSIFLHIRQLMLICRWSKSSPPYRLNSLLNIGSYITFRIMTFAWMTRWLFLNKDSIPLGLYSIGSIGLAIITLMNIVLFYRLLKTDFINNIQSNENSNKDRD